MNDKTLEHYFPIAKLIYIFSIVVYFIAINKSYNYSEGILEVALLLIFTSVTVLYEIIDRSRITLLIISCILSAILTYLLPEVYISLVPIAVLDLISYFMLPAYFYLVIFLIILRQDGNTIVYFIECIYCSIMYFQHYFIVNKYKAMLKSFIDSEEHLKTSIESQRLKYQNDIVRFNLSFENKLLEEKSRLSQALHDKIGHSINGSVYQLEACKLLMDKSPTDSKNIIQAVIDNLRKSHDEIRAILRNEKPNKGEMALLQIRKLCEDFNKNYSINARLVCSGKVTDAPEYLWEIILANSIEAFTNALKYSGCKNIKIDIAILNKIVRCSIRDDGRGCSHITEGMGLSGMKERIAAVNGVMSVASELGFEINMILPIDQASKID